MNIVPTKIIEENIVDEKSLRILKCMVEGLEKKDIARKLHISKRTIDNKLKELRKNKIIKEKSVPVVDIFRLFNNVYGVQVKCHQAAIESKTDSQSYKGLITPASWVDMIKTLKNAIGDELYTRLVRFAAGSIGAQHDVFFIVTIQSLEEYNEFLRKLQMSGIVDSVQTITFAPLEGGCFEPVAVPNPDEWVITNWKYKMK